MIITEFKNYNKQEATNIEVAKARKYIDIKHDRFDELKKIIETKINETDSIMIYTNDSTVSNIDLFIKPNILFEKKTPSPYGQYESLSNLYFPDYEKITNDNKKTIDNLNSFISNKEHYGFSIYHIDTIRKRSFKLTNKFNDSLTYYSVAQFTYLTNKQKNKHIKRIKEASEDELDDTKEKQIENLNKEFHNKIIIDDEELQNQKTKNEFHQRLMPQLGVYKKSYYYFACSNNSLNEEQFKEKIKLFESMFILKSKKHLKGRIIKVKLKDFEEIGNQTIKLSKKEWMSLLIF